jgi:hypothetical protein
MRVGRARGESSKRGGSFDGGAAAKTAVRRVVRDGYLKYNIIYDKKKIPPPRNRRVYYSLFFLVYQLLYHVPGFSWLLDVIVCAVAHGANKLDFLVYTACTRVQTVSLDPYSCVYLFTRHTFSGI